MRTKIITLLVFCAFFSGCVTPPPKLDPKKTVTFHGGVFEPALRQDGLVIDHADAINRFAEIEEAKSSAENAKVLYWTSVLSAGLGGWFLGTWIGQKDKRPENLGAGAGFLGLAFLLGHFHKSSLEKAVDIYNSNLKASKKSALSIEPGFIPVAGGVAAGVQIGF